MANYYGLEGKKVTPCDQDEAWEQLVEKSGRRHVDYTYVGESRVSTVFVGIGHAYARLTGHEQVLLGLSLEELLRR